MAATVARPAIEPATASACEAAQAVRRRNSTPVAASATAIIPVHQAMASDALSPIGVPISSPRSVSITGVAGWCSAKPCSHEEKVSVVLLVTGLVRNHATLEAQLAAAMQSADSQQVMLSYGRMLARLTDEGRFPALHAAIAAGVFDGGGDGDAGYDLDVDFAFGLERALDGIEAFIGDRQG